MEADEDIPKLVPGTVRRDDEHVVFWIVRPTGDHAAAWLAPADPFDAGCQIFLIEWNIGSSSADDRAWRDKILLQLRDCWSKVGFIYAWTELAFALRDGVPVDDNLDWEHVNPLPIVPYRGDWDFSKIPDDELIVCSLWEYGRESNTFAMLAAYYWLHDRLSRLQRGEAIDPAREKWEAREQARIEAWFAETQYDSDAFLERYWETDFPLIGIYDIIQSSGGTGADPWQSLPLESRQLLVRKVDETYTLRPLTLTLIGDLETLWNANNGRLLEIRAENRPPEDDCEDVEMFSETKWVEIEGDFEKPPERIVAALTVDFSRFTDREILQSFEQWLKQTRPEPWKKPRRVFPNSPQRGRKLIDYRIALERLGLMRLLHESYPNELRDHYPDVWKRMCRGDTHFRRECQLACEFYRALFPFLPEDDVPRSANGLEVWLPKVEAEVARQKTQQNEETGNNSGPICSP